MIWIYPKINLRAQIKSVINNKNNDIIDSEEENLYRFEEGSTWFKNSDFTEKELKNYSDNRILKH